MIRLSTVASADISVVIQGPLRLAQPEGVQQCLNTVRWFLPAAEVIVSTWEGEPVQELPAWVQVLTSPDPGGLTDVHGYGYNLVRQLVSTGAGVAAATRPYVLKLRTDCRLSGTQLCRAPPRRPHAWGEPLVITSFFTRDPEQMPLLFHPSDIAMFGSREAMTAFWCGEPPPREHYWLPQPLAQLSSPFHLSHQRQVPEQALTLRWIRRQGLDIDLPHPAYCTAELLALWSRLLSREFELLDAHRSGIVFPRRFYRAAGDGYTLLTPARFHALAQRPFSYARARLAALSPLSPAPVPRLYGSAEKLLYLAGAGPGSFGWQCLKRAKQAVRKALGYPPQTPGRYA